MDGTSKLFARGLQPALEAALADTPVVCLLGPRQCGKTTLARMAQPGRPYVSLDDENFARTATLDPVGFVASLPDRVTVDEMQRVPALLSAMKMVVDRDRRPGRFLLTGSANLLLLPQVQESLAGRNETLWLQPLTEAEKQRAPGRFLENFLEGRLKPQFGMGPVARGASLESRLLAGGYPEPCTRPPDRARQWHRQYLKAIIERDIKDVARVREGDELGRLLELLALQTGCLLNVSALGLTLGLHRNTAEHYLSLLERLFLVRRLQPWHRNAAHRLAKTPKVHVVDSGLAATLRGTREGDWLQHREAMGHLLESWVVQQLLTQGSWTDPDLRFWHYRDKDKVEVDLVITQGRRVWGVEIKASATVTGREARGLQRLASHAGPDFQGGILLYDGNDILPCGLGQFLAVPLRRLWED
jgi:predicted AAA+ superfamily ATPase